MNTLVDAGQSCAALSPQSPAASAVRGDVTASAWTSTPLAHMHALIRVCSSRTCPGSREPPPCSTRSQGPLASICSAGWQHDDRVAAFPLQAAGMLFGEKPCEARCEFGSRVPAAVPSGPAMRLPVTALTRHASCCLRRPLESRCHRRPVAC